ncbi:hypothetical protein GK047_24965 [Paenibacillus sp. SYP-B3998]|uniref:DUF1453 family protein n=1 Tax=Paenibacillus sp. SYP-B3998 TaxID=2678564 RepID=A0A6G4A5Z6_9BACL|nr:hypothetical protein [Paenibacillus sp. SYP-B3998]NEW09229.1 hypothetical protein [Paenibacillus sp. SYP-B3998]
MQNWSHYVIPFLIIGFVIYRRTKRTIGFQRLSPRRLKFRLILFSLIGLIIFMLGFVHPIHFISYAIGLAAGVALGLTAIRHTRFEQRPDGWYYRTHLWVEIAVLVLFLSRIAYRLVFITVVSNSASMNPADLSQFTKDPLTAGVFFVIVSYYILFLSYLLREEVKLEKNPPSLDDKNSSSSVSNATLDNV